MYHIVLAKYETKYLKLIFPVAAIPVLSPHMLHLVLSSALAWVEDIYKGKV